VKQRLTPDDVLQLSPEQQEKLRVWWKVHKEEGDWYAFIEDGEFYTEIVGHCDGYRNCECQVNDGEDPSCRPKENSLPLLSIGQLLQLLETYTPKIEKGRHWMMEIVTGKLPNYNFPKYQNKELVDCLFQAVKEIL